MVNFFCMFLFQILYQNHVLYNQKKIFLIVIDMDSKVFFFQKDY